MKKIYFTGKYSHLCAIVDDSDYEYLSQFVWYGKDERGGFRALRNIDTKGNKRSMHREILNAPTDKVIDHINGNSLDNRRGNLRICTQQQNSCNQRKRKNTTSQYKGVSWSKLHNKWEAYIMLNRKRTYLGLHEEEENAALAYDAKATELFGEFASTNLI